MNDEEIIFSDFEETLEDFLDNDEGSADDEVDQPAEESEEEPEEDLQEEPEEDLQEEPEEEQVEWLEEESEVQPEEETEAVALISDVTYEDWMTAQNNQVAAWMTVNIWLAFFLGWFVCREVLKIWKEA